MRYKKLSVRDFGQLRGVLKKAPVKYPMICTKTFFVCTNFQKTSARFFKTQSVCFPVYPQGLYRGSRYNRAFLSSLYNFPDLCSRDILTETHKR